MNTSQEANSENFSDLKVHDLSSGTTEGEDLSETATNNMCVNNIDESELDEETITKLRGDAIGETVYSKRFVLRTLLQFSDVDWNEEFEKDICILWDMTVDKDVCQYLLEISFPSLACSAILRYKDNLRFVEIIIGSFANILSICKDKKLTSEEIYAVIFHLNSEDALVLIQAIRFMIAIVHNNDSIYFMDEDIFNKIIFILTNSLNHDLVLKTLNLVVTLTSNFKLDNKFINPELFDSCFKAYFTLMDLLEEKDRDREFDTKENQEVLTHFINSLSNICCYADTYRNTNLLDSLKIYRSSVLKEFCLIFGFFICEDHLFPLSEQIEVSLTGAVNIIRTLHLKFVPNLFKYMFKILYLLHCNGISTEDECFMSVVECVCYFIYRGEENCIIKALREFSATKITKTVFEIIEKTDEKYAFNYRTNLVRILNKIR